MDKPGTKNQDEFRIAVTMTVVWVAGLTLALIFVGLAAGVLLDGWLHTKPLFTIVFILASIPVTIYATVRVVRAASRRLQPVAQKEKKEHSEEEANRGEDN